ncbi:MAG: hypothetical protein NTX61_14085 [Bacteroidetes bacterium]|nr:hypothetical protein [Bacteroidota bacterium]
MKIRSGIIWICLILVKGISAQYFTTGQDPASIHWRQIKTEHYRIIYPASFEQKSQYLANILDLVIKADTHTLKSKVPRIPFVIHQQSAYSNGITIWAPKRIEIYPCPPQDIYDEAWFEQLAIHEYRHAIQTSKMNRGFTRILSWIFGEQATGAVLGLFIPSWFLEGDAVAAETSLSRSGRGRIANFEGVLRAQLLEKGKYSYDKAVLGSYRTFIPDQYSLGYFLVAETRRKYGPSLWNYTLDHVAMYPFMVVPFSDGIRRITGLSKVKLYKETLASLDSAWTKQESGTHFTDMLRTIPDRRNYTLYQFPNYINDSMIVAEKYSIDKIDHFVIVDNKGKEKKLFTPGLYQRQSLSVAKGLLVWAESVPDIRWNNRDHSVIRIFDIFKKNVRNLTTRTRYFAPAISRDGTHVAAVRVNLQNESFLEILDVKSGNVLKSFPFVNGDFAITPSWNEQGSQIALSFLTGKGRCIGVMDASSGKFTQYSSWQFNEITGPTRFYRQYLLFTGNYSGIENIYALDTVTRKIFQITSSRFGASNPDVDETHDKLVYADYCSDGMMIAQSDITPEKWIPLENIHDNSIKLWKTLSQQENINIQDSVWLRGIHKMYENPMFDLTRDSIRGKLYASRKYSKILHLFNIHSWAPAAFDINNLLFDPGVSVFSQNLLSTMVGSAGYAYNVSEQTGKVFADLSYQGLYPVFDINASYGGRSSYYIIRNTGESVHYGWNELVLTGTISIPWNFSHGKFYRYLTPSAGTSITDIIHTPKTPGFYTKGIIQSMNYRFYFLNKIRSVPKDMYPRWEQILDLNFRNTPFQGNSMGSISGIETNLFFPGILNHHSLWFYGGFQHREYNPNSIYQFADLINYPRGITGHANSDIYSVEINYKFPLFYPDFSAGSLAYFKRFKLNLFYDYAEGTYENSRTIYRSTGAELTTDLHLLRFLIPFELGVRSIYFPGNKTFGFEFLYSVNY